MLTKRLIDRKLKRYVREHSGKGYSKDSIKKVLIEHGYDEKYVVSLMKQHSELQLMKAYSAISIILLVLFFSLSLINTSQKNEITTLAVEEVDPRAEGCCTPICRQTGEAECYGNFTSGERCNLLQECNVGCCIDKEGYCLTNYLEGNCKNGEGGMVYKDCKDIVFCRNLTDTSFLSRQYNIKNNKGSGFLTLKPLADKYQSSFNIRYFLYDKSNVISVQALIKDDGGQIDSIYLYDDGSHNDASKNDNLYANNWLSSRIAGFDGFKKLVIDILVTYEDGKTRAFNNVQSLMVFNSDCIPIHNEIERKKNAIILAADKYDNISEGYSKFVTDSNSLLKMVQSLENFSSSINVYRLESLLSYPSSDDLAKLAAKSCPSYNVQNDLIIIMDNYQDYCTKEQDGVIRTNSQSVIFKNLSHAFTDEAFGDFCSYVLTPKQFTDEIIKALTPPEITADLADNLTYNETSLKLSYEISSANYPVNYSVLVENAIVKNEVINENISDSVVLELANGSNAVLIEAQDKNKNYAYIPLLINVSLEQNE